MDRLIRASFILHSPRVPGLGFPTNFLPLGGQTCCYYYRLSVSLDEALGKKGFELELYISNDDDRSIGEQQVAEPNNEKEQKETVQPTTYLLLYSLETLGICPLA